MMFGHEVLAPAPLGKPVLRPMQLINQRSGIRPMKAPSISTKILITALGIVVASLLHYVTPHSRLFLHNLFQKLYYLPIIYAAIAFGWRGGLLAAVVSTICYIPHILTWRHQPYYAKTPAPADWKRIPSDTFSTTTAYRAGAIVLFSNQIYRARIDNPGTNLNTVTDWQLIGTLGNQYVTVTDSIQPVSGLLNLDISAATLPAATVRVFAAGATAAATEQTFSAPQATLSQIQVDLRGLTPGRYGVQVNDAAGTVAREARCFLSPQAIAGNWFGVIEIGHGTRDFALFNSDGTLRTPRYALRFLNRATRWRNIFPAAQAVGAGAEVAVEGGNNRVLVTPALRTLTRFGSGSRLQADSPATANVSEEILLPAPEVNSIRRQNAEWFSETQVPNYTVGP